MSALLRIYDSVTSNNGVSLGITVASTAFMAYRAFSFIGDANPLIFIISAFCGVVFALIANKYLAHNDAVKSEGERNTLYATLSFILVISPLDEKSLRYYLYNRHSEKYLLCPETCANVFTGFEVGFLVTNLALQLLEGQTKFKFQSPFVFE